MSNHSDQPIYRTFEEFEREELRRAEAIGSAADPLFDDLFAEESEPEPGSSGGRLGYYDFADDEE